MHGSQTLRAQHYISKSDLPPDRIPSNCTAPKPTETSKSNCNPQTASSSIQTSTSEPSPIASQLPSKSRKHRKKKRKKGHHGKHSHAPILIFPYSWIVKDDQYENNKQFHKKSKPMSPRIALQHGIDHLLSPSKCSKRYLSAYMLNLHQLTTAETLLDSIIRKCTPVIKQLQHINNESTAPIKPHAHPRDIISPVVSPSGLNPFTPSKYSLTDNEFVSIPSYESPVQWAKKKADNTTESTTSKKHKIASSLPIPVPASIPVSIPVSTLALVETRSCPELDNEYNNMSDNTPTTPPANDTASVLLVTSKSTPMLAKTEAMVPSKATNHKTKMKSYCIATIKHNIDIMYHWVYYYPEDFAVDKLLDRLLNYIHKVRDKIPSQNSIIRRWQKLLQLMQHRKPEMKHSNIFSSSISNLRILPQVREHDRKTSFQFTDSFFPPREMVEKLGGSIDLLQIHPALVADQLTLIDTEIFLQIRPREFTNKSWQNRPNLECTRLFNDDFDGDKAQNFSIYDNLKRQKIDAPNLLYMIDHVNRLSLWVATEILSRNTTAEMADLTKYFYVVAHRCLELCNIHTCTAIFGGICLQPLTRLRRLNRYLADDEQIQTLHGALSEMVSSNHNYKTYRKFIEQWYNHPEDTSPRPCIPFIPVVMKDLFQIQLHLVQRKRASEESKGVDDGKKHIDLGLLEKNCRHIRRVYEAQQHAKLYANQLPADTDIQSKLRMNIAKFETHETLRRWSFEIQPKLTKEDKENLEMIDTLEEFGFL
eukprot:46538_1